MTPFPILRHTQTQQETTFDVLIVGGGIYGTWMAYDAALRGLSVALIETKDYGCGTSQSSSKLIHGGLRYLEHYEFKLVSHALTERRVLSQITPNLVQPLSFMVPVWKSSRVGRMQLLAGLTLYDFMATGKQPVPRHKSHSREALRQDCGYLLQDGLKGGLSYGDCQEDDARMTLVVAAAAQSRGAAIAHGVRAERILVEQGKVAGAEVLDTQTQARYTIRAKQVVNAAGPWAKDLITPVLGQSTPPVKLVKGIHLIFPAIAGLTHAFLLTAPSDGRVFFVIPWYGRTLVGTTEASIADMQSCDVTSAEAQYLVDALKALMPGLGWTADDIIGRFAGARTLQAEDAANLSAQTREFAVEQPLPGLLWPIGGKYTTARVDAAQVVDQLLTNLGRPPQECLTHRYPLPGAPVGTREGSVMLGDFVSWQTEAIAGLERRGLARDVATFLTQRHGTRIARIQSLLNDDPSLATRLVPELPFIEAEVVLAVRDEGALSLEDITRRRMPLDLLARPGAWQQRVAELAGAEMAKMARGM